MSYESECEKLIKKYTMINHEIINETKSCGYDGEIALALKNVDKQFEHELKIIKEKYTRI